MTGMKLIEEGSLDFLERPTYLKNRPADRALVVSDGKRGVCLDYIGPAFEWWNDSCGFEDDFDGLPAGVWIFEGTIRTWENWTDYGYEHDAELEGTERALTDEEWELFKADREGPWDPWLWIDRKNKPDPKPEATTLSPDDEPASDIPF